MLVKPTQRGLYCEHGGFYVDPWRPVERALITHAHADHATSGCRAYLCSATCRGVLSERLPGNSVIESLPFSHSMRINDVTVSFHPAGHILGSAQIRIEHKGEVTVVSGDYKTAPDPSCEVFEPVPCQHFITESTFGLPVYQWPDPASVFAEIAQWWQSNREAGRTSILFAYSLGKTQRVLAGLHPDNGLWPQHADFVPGSEKAPIGLHGSATKFPAHYAQAGKLLAPTLPATAPNAASLKGRGLVVAPASARNTPWLRKFSPYTLAAASGWMALRGPRRRESLDRGFTLSDHCDWPGLLEAIRSTGARTIGVTHGQTAPVIRFLREEWGLNAIEIPTRYSGDTETPPQAEPAEES